VAGGTEFVREERTSFVFAAEITELDDLAIVVTQQAELSVTSASTNTGSVISGNDVQVTATVANTGPVSGTETVRFAVDGATEATRTVTVAGDSNKTVQADVTLIQTGDRRITVNGVSAGTVSVNPSGDDDDDDDRSDRESGGDGGGAPPVDTPAPPAVPSNAVQSESVSISDTDAFTAGIQLPVADSNTSIVGVTVAEEVNGSVSVADLDGLPEDVPDPGLQTVSVHAVEVPTSVANQSGQVSIEVDDVPAGVASDSLQISRYDDETDAWASLPTNVTRENGTLVLTADTPGFSVFAVTVAETTPTATPTATPTEEPATPTVTPTATPTEEPATPTPTDSGGLPGFGLLVAIIALIGTALLLRRREREA
jgi:PGF-CTERM protein